MRVRLEELRIRHSRQSCRVNCFGAAADRVEMFGDEATRIVEELQYIAIKKTFSLVVSDL